MRQIFSSQRLETVEGVARLLEEAGIGVHISQPRSYHSRRRGQFSYAEPVSTKQQPAVWIRDPEDQMRARELLREAGLLATTRSYSGQRPAATETLVSPYESSGNRWAWRLRIGLLVVIAGVAVYIWLSRHPQPAPQVPQQAQPATPPVQEQDQGEEEIRVRIPTPPPAPSP